MGMYAKSTFNKTCPYCGKVDGRLGRHIHEKHNATYEEAICYKYNLNSIPMCPICKIRPLKIWGTDLIRTCGDRRCTKIAVSRKYLESPLIPPSSIMDFPVDLHKWILLLPPPPDGIEYDKHGWMLGKVYMFKFPEENRLKVGVSSAINNRIRELMSLGVNVRDMMVIDNITIERAYSIEAWIHYTFKSKADSLPDCYDECYRDSGLNEYFDIDIYNEVIEYTKNKLGYEFKSYTWDQ